MPDSSTGGYLLPSTTILAEPLEGQALHRFFQQIFVGITALPVDLVRPRWQQEPPDRPAINVNWLAFGVADVRANVFSQTWHNEPFPLTGPLANGYDLVQNHEELDILCSFFGPNADANAAKLRSGLAVAQNREILTLNGYAFIEALSATPVPSLTNERYYYQVDLPTRFRRVVTRVYPVLNILSANGTINDEQRITPFSVHSS